MAHCKMLDGGVSLVGSAFDGQGDVTDPSWGHLAFSSLGFSFLWFLHGGKLNKK